MPLVNRRRNPIDSTVAAVTITDEAHTVAEFDELPGVYGFILEERPVAGTVSVRQDNTAETPFTIVLTSPLAGQVFVDFNENRGYCIFNSADNGKAILVTYGGSGANNTVENIRAIAGEEIDAQRNAASGLAEFNASRQLKLPNTAGTQTSLLTNANAASRTYTLPDKSGTVAMLDDVTAPDLGPIIDAATVASSISDTDKFAAARDASENLISVAWSLIKSSIFGAINGLTSKSTPVGDDVIAIGDSAASFAGKKVTLTELFAQFPPVTAPVAWTPTFTGFGTVSGVTAYSWRVGSELFFEIRFLSGIPSSTEARISLGFNGTNGNVTSASNYPALQQIGVGGSGDQVGRSYTIIMEPSVAYLTIGMGDASNGALVKRNGDALLANGWSFACKGSVRINGW